MVSDGQLLCFANHDTGQVAHVAVSGFKVAGGEDQDPVVHLLHGLAVLFRHDVKMVASLGVVDLVERIHQCVPVAGLKPKVKLVELPRGGVLETNAVEKFLNKYRLHPFRIFLLFGGTARIEVAQIKDLPGPDVVQRKGLFLFHLAGDLQFVGRVLGKNDWNGNKKEKEGEYFFHREEMVEGVNLRCRQENPANSGNPGPRRPGFFTYGKKKSHFIFCPNPATKFFFILFFAVNRTNGGNSG